MSGDPTDPWIDLARNQPGQHARRQAIERREQAPVKTFLARILRVHTDERAWRVGADGEQQVARRLRKLPDGWYVIHSVPVGTRGSDIDHIVIGPGGVYTLNTKHHTGGQVWVSERVFLVNGQRTDYLRNSRHEAARAARLLSSAAVQVLVEPVIVVLASQLTIKGSPDGVHVVSAARLTRWLKRRPTTLTPTTGENIFELARRDTTWRAG